MKRNIGIKVLIKKIIYIIVRNKFGWTILNILFIRVADYAKHVKTLQKNKDTEEFIKNTINISCPDLVVKHGPFKGMKYTEMKSFGSKLYPKLLGSYEKEIQHIIEEVCKQEYTEVVDVGCAEGYYAIGLAMKLPKAKIYAYDTNQEAVRFCQNLAKMNNVDQRIIVGEFCSSETLQGICFRGKGLIISDCEGYETSLFSEDSIPFLSQHDLLIELHDFIDINISSTIRKRFEMTHKIITIESIDDIKKAQTYNYEELNKYNLQERKKLLGEERPSIMQWYYMKSFNGDCRTH